MPVIVVAATEEGAGATTLAAGLAHRLAYAGHTVELARLEGDPRAEGDAAAFATLEFATASGAPVALEGLRASDATTLIVEAAPGHGPAAAAKLGARLVIVGPAPLEGDGAAVLIENRARTPGPRRIPEDRLLAAPTVRALIEASRARVLARALTADDDVCEHIVVSPIASDPNDDHFRRYPRKAVVARAEKVDSALAALRSDTRCLILSGGAEPSPYIIDRVAADRRVTLLLAPEGTVETVRDIEATFGASPFSGEDKLERIGALVAAAVDDATIAALVA